MKRWIAVILTLAMLMGLSGCGAGDSDQGSDTASGNKEGKIEIRLLTRMAGTSNQVMIYKDIIKAFEAKYPDVTVIDESQGDESAFNNKLKADLASGTLPNIFRIQGVANLGQYIDNGLLMDMEPVLKEDSAWGEGFSKGSLSYYQINGKAGTYGIPMESGLIGVYYNESLFKKAGVEQFPETWDDLKIAIGKLNAIDVKPVALGAKSSYMAGHLHNQIFYKWMGTEAAKKLGSRELKWTDAEVVKTLEFVKELDGLNAFGKNVAGISDDIVLTEFLQGKAAMIITGPWNIGKFTNPEETPFVEDIKVAKFPYFSEKPEFKDHDMQIVSPYMVNGKLEGKEKDYTLELLKMLTDASAAKRFAEESQFLIPRSDIDIDASKVSPLFLENIKLVGTSTGLAVDVFDFDPLPSMQDRTRNSVVSLFVGATPEQAAQEIQAEIDK